MTGFEEIYSTYFNDVFRYIRRLSGSEDIAEEITSEAFFKALYAIDRFDGRCEVRVWLCQIARNCYFTYLKKHRRIDSLDDESFGELPDDGETIDEELARKDDLRAIRKAMEQLPERYREVFTWRVCGELSFRQIGELFGKSENWACVTYHRAREMIRESVKPS